MKKILFAFAVIVGVCVSARAANNCTGATYYDSDTDTCIACPAGYDYNTDPGKTDITQCQIHCDAGTWNGEYIQLEYIESTGTQYIQTQYYANPNTKVYADFQLTSSNSQQYLFGEYSSNTSSLCFAVYINNNGKFTECSYNGNGGHPSNNNVDLNRHQLMLSASNHIEYFTDVTFSSVSYASTKTTTEPIKIFGNNTSTTNNTKMKLYSFRIWDNDVLVHDFVPVRRDSDGAIGMYDTVTRTFFGNSGTGTFIAGDDVGSIGGQCVDVGAGYYATASTVNYGSVGTRSACPAGTYSNNPNATSINDCTPCSGATYNDETAQAECTSCPSGYDANTTAGKTSINDCQIHCDGGTYVETVEIIGYTQLEYIESTGTQYIDTGYIYTDNSTAHIIIDTEFTNFTTPNWKSHGLSGTYYGGPAVGVNNSNYLSGTANGDFSTGVPASLNTRYLFDLDVPNKSFNVTDVENNMVVATKNDFSNSYNGASRPSFMLFGYFTSGKSPVKNSSKIYSAKLYDNGTLVRDFIPVRRHSDGAIGMYDKVTDTFFGNAGTGTFIAGNDIGQCIDVGAGYYAPASTVNFGSVGTRTQCPAGLYTVGYGHGADDANDCGRILHVGDNVIYTRRNKETTPSVNIKMDNGDMFYISLSPTDHTVSRLHFQYNGNEYTAYDDSLFYGERDFDTGQQISQ